MLNPKNPRSRPVTKLCHTLETFRRTDEGRVRDATAFLGHYFPQDKDGARDRLFVHMPKEVRADLLSSWGIRGKKSALRDTDEKVRLTVADSLAAGDVDASVVETGVTPEILVDWVPLEDWWSFWRGHTLPLGSVRKALAVARELALFDERWFLENLKLGTQKLTGTDVICAALSKDQVVAWVHAVHTSGDASPAGLVAALGWETIFAKTAHEALLFTLDALARQVALAPPLETKTEAAPSPKAGPALAPVTRASEPPRPRASEPPRPANAEPPKPAEPVKAAEPPTSEESLKSVDSPKAAEEPPKSEVKAATAATAATAAAPPAAMSPTAAPAAAPAPAANAPAVSPLSVTAPMPAYTLPATATAAASAKPGMSKPPPLPAAAKASTPPASMKPPSRQMAAVTVTEPPAGSTAPIPPAPVSTPPSARQLFGAPTVEPAAPPPMRPPQRTLVGVGSPLFGSQPPTQAEEDDLLATFDVDEASPPSNEDAGVFPPPAEPGDMGWDLVHGVKRPMPNNVQPKYNFGEKDDEPTSEIDLSDLSRS